MADGVSLRERRQVLLAQPSLRGTAFCRAFASEADRWLAAICDRASGGRSDGLALVAVGGYGCRTLFPWSDLDLVLVHERRADVAAVADAIWYPIWDEGVSLDHSVRRPDEVRTVAASDLRVALGLLDGRVVWGDAPLGHRLVSAARASWRRSFPSTWSSLLHEQAAERWARSGDVAFLLEPHLKESRGGLRDIQMLRALASAVPGLAETVDLDGAERASETIVAARVELHRSAGRALDRLLLQDQDQVAESLAYADADALVGAVAESGRTIAWTGEDAWQCQRRSAARPHATGGGVATTRIRRWTGGRPPVRTSTRAAVEPGIAVVGEEVVADGADGAADRSLPFRLAAVAAERGLPLGRSTVRHLGAVVPDPPDPWPPSMRAALVRVLAAGPPAVGALEALDRGGLLVRLIPEWASVRNRPQRNAYHRYTVDRHLLEAAAIAAGLTDRVARPELLLAGALLHDIGKGTPGDHTATGIQIVAALGRRMGFAPPDVATLVDLCRWHLLLPDTATRRDLADPATVDTVAAAVGTTEMLHLLAALTEADARATGPAAWGPWKAGLVAELVERVDRRLAGAPHPPPPPHPAARYPTLVAAVRANGRPAVSMEPPVLVVAALDRRGLLAAVAGTLAVNGLDIRRADASSIEGIAIEELVVSTRRDSWPAPARICSDLEAVLDGRLELGGRLAARARDSATARRPQTAEPVVPAVSIDTEASVASTVLEVRALDEIGLLHRVTRVLFDCGLDVISARASTVGEVAVDAFYVRDASGRKITDPSMHQRIERSLREELA